MQIINKTNNTVLADQVEIADTLSKRMLGLLKRKEFKKGEALVLAPCNSIHTFFMHFAIDVLFVNKHNQVVKIIPALIPGRLTRIYFNSALVIELPAGVVQSTLTSEGDTLSLE